MITRSDSPWLKANNARRNTEPESSVYDMCDNDFESFNSNDMLTSNSSEVDTSAEIQQDSDEERAKAAEVYGRTPSPKQRTIP